MYCELAMADDEIFDHQDICGARSDSCPYCSKMVIVKNLTSHFCNEMAVKYQSEHNNYINGK
jgi:hypothetical protein